MNNQIFQRPARLMNSLDMVKHIETMLQMAPRMHINGRTVVLIPVENAESWIAFLGTLASAAEKKEKGKKKDG